MASSIRDILYQNKLKRGYTPPKATSPMDAAGLPEDSVLNQPAGSISSAYGFVPADQKQGVIADTIREAIARAQGDARSNGDPTGLRDRMERLGGVPDEEMLAAADSPALPEAVDGVSRMQQQATTQHQGEPAIAVTGSLQSHPSYADFIRAKQKVAQLPPMSNLEATQLGVNTPALKSVGREYRDMTKPHGPMTLGAEQARNQAWQNADNRKSIREAARVANLDKMNADKQGRMAAQAEQWLMMNKPAEYAQMLQARANGLEAQAKNAEATTGSPQAKMDMVTSGIKQGNDLPALAAGLPQEAIDQFKQQQEIQSGQLGPRTNVALRGIHDSSDIHYGPEWLGLPHSSDKASFLQSVAASGLGISPEIASQWWDQNIAGRGIRGVGRTVRGAIAALPGLGGGPLASGASGGW